MVKEKVTQVEKEKSQGSNKTVTKSNNKRQDDKNHAGEGLCYADEEGEQRSERNEGSNNTLKGP